MLFPLLPPSIFAYLEKMLTENSIVPSPLLSLFLFYQEKTLQVVKRQCSQAEATGSLCSVGARSGIIPKVLIRLNSLSPNRLQKRY